MAISLTRPALWEVPILPACPFIIHGFSWVSKAVLSCWNKTSTPKSKNKQQTPLKVPSTSFPEGKPSNKIMEGTSPAIKIFNFVHSRCLQICKANLRTLAPYRSFPVVTDSPWSSDFSKHMSEDDFTGGDAVVAVYHQKYLGLFWTRLHPFGRQILGRVFAQSWTCFSRRTHLFTSIFSFGCPIEFFCWRVMSCGKVWKSPETPNGYVQWGVANTPGSQWVNNTVSIHVYEGSPFITFNSRLGVFPSLSPKTIKPCRIRTVRSTVRLTRCAVWGIVLASRWSWAKLPSVWRKCNLEEVWKIADVVNPPWNEEVRLGK